MTAERIYISGRFIILSAGFLLFIGLCVASFAAIAVPLPLFKSIVAIIPVMMLCFIPVYAGRFICRFFPTDWPHLGRTLSAQSVFISIATIALSFVWMIYCLCINLLMPEYLNSTIFFRTLLVLVPSLFMLLAFAQTIHYLVLTLEEKKRASEELLTQKLATAEAELSLVKNSIHPHFLFNSLSMLKSLIRTNPVSAEKALTDLSDFLIYSIHFANRNEVPLADEIAHAKHYAEIEDLRGITDFNLAISVPDICNQCTVLPFILQPLIENALKHGIRQCPSGGKIAVDAAIRDSFLLITVTNSLPPDYTRAQTNDRCGGTGLKTLAKRLSHRYQGQAKIDLQVENNEFTVCVKIPIA